MRSRERDAPRGAGADHGLAHGLVGVGGALPTPPRTIEEAVETAAETHGAKTARMLRHFADLDEGSLLWTRAADGTYHLGRVAGPWRYDDSPGAREVGIQHVRPATWVDRPFGEAEIPEAVARTFARGGRNLQRTHDERAERQTESLWDRHGPRG